MTTSETTSPPEYSSPSRGLRVGHELGFWVAAAAFLVVMAFSTVPTPLWALYQQHDHFSTFTITIAFAVYAVGVVVSLFLGGHLGDTVGRRRLLVPAIGLEIAAAVVLVVTPDLAALLVARVVSGLGVGLLTATITAHILDLHLTSRPHAGPLRGQVAAGVANLGGFGVGALASGALAEHTSAPLRVPYVVFLVLLVVALIGICLVPETALPPVERIPYRPQQVRVPPTARAQYLLSSGIAFAAFALLGLFTSLAPVFVSGQLHVTSRTTAGAVAFAAFASAALAQASARFLGLRTQIATGALFAVAGIVLLTYVVTATAGLGLFYLAGIGSGIGAGLLFKAAIAVAGSSAEAAHRGEALAGFFLAGYAGLTVPVVGVGIATLTVSAATALQGFAVVVSVIAFATAVALLVVLRPDRPATAAAGAQEPGGPRNFVGVHGEDHLGR